MITKSIFALTFLAVVSSLHADWEIVQKTSAMGQDNTMTIKIKDTLIRSDMGSKMTVILDTTKGSSEMYMHDRKMKMVVDAAALKSAGEMAAKMAGGGEGKPAAAKATGEKVKVGEWETEVYTWEGKIGTGKFYVAKDFPKFAELNKVMEKTSQSMNNPMAALFPKLTEFPGMVVKSEMAVMGQKSTSELVSATEKPLNSDEFKGPEGYQEMKMPGMPGLGK